MRSWRASEAGSLGRLYARCVVTLRWPIVLGWAVVLRSGRALAAGHHAAGRPGRLRAPEQQGHRDRAASAEAFGFPLLSRTLLVQRNESGLSEGAQQRAVERAVGVAKGTDR